jgi:uncharacterized protein (DUF2141 family)
MNKRILPLIALVSLIGAAPASAGEPSPPAGSIRVIVGNLRSTKGLVGVALFSSDRGFPDKQERAREGLSVPADGNCEVVFSNVPYGTYAVSVLHDENVNGRMDKNFIGIPKEGFGASNNPKIRRGPPSFSESRFTVEKREVALTVDMNYF